MKILPLLCLFLTGCGWVPQKVPPSDAEVQRLLGAAREFPRERHGFTPLTLTPDAEVRIERRARASYDVMLHIYGKTSRTIAFVRNGAGFRWIHEQEIFRGPNFYDSPDGRCQESLCLTYETSPVAGSKTNDLQVRYAGGDPRWLHRELRLSDAEAILGEWGRGQPRAVGAEPAERQR